MKHLAILTLISITTAHAASAASALVAGWDFSNVANISNNTLSANHCDWIRSTNKFGVGDGSAYGMLYFNGEYGSTHPDGIVRGDSNNLTENQNIERYDSWYREMVDPDYVGTLAPFNTLPTGQTNPNPKSLYVNEAGVTFNVKHNASMFRNISFAAALAGTRSDGMGTKVWVQFTTNGDFNTHINNTVHYAFDLIETEQTFSITENDLSRLGSSEEIYMRIFAVAQEGEMVDVESFYLDNVAFNSILIPEPASYALLFGGVVLALAVLRRKRLQGSGSFFSTQNPSHLTNR